MTDQIQLSQAATDELADLPDILVVWGGTAVLAGVIELNPDTNVLVATRSRTTSRWPGERLVTTSAAEAIDFLGRRGHPRPP
jgi:hypothetical protein